eukprot:TRINITY_DN77_c0_g1_i2.p1 TRINITY_DN77_c0_g1~~TRINITY_DN77_c0_g1_i2.p1  ORF type:complete len:243 (-),score=64.13 TRINITY_DN77_c0_g1_i2:42-770(-)
MKINIAYPAWGSQKIIEYDDDRIVRFLYDKKISEDFLADPLGEQFRGYVMRITGGFDKQGFPMKQGVLRPDRTRLLLGAETGLRVMRKGERKRKSVRGCIVAQDISLLNVIIVKKGDAELEGLTDEASYRPSRLGPKRANNIRKVFKLSPEDDVREFVVRRALPKKEGEEDKPTQYKAPKIQRLITPERLQRKRRRVALKKRRTEKNKQAAAEYAKLLAQIRAEKRAAQASKSRKSTRSTKA